VATEQAIPPGPVTPATSYAIQQTADLRRLSRPIVDFGIDLNLVTAKQGNYAWEQQPPLPPATQLSETVYDSNGQPETSYHSIYSSKMTWAPGD